MSLDLYKDREHSYIKHRFLTSYLQAAAYKTFQGRSPIFNFVDAFAGPWRVSDEAEYSDASFDQAINTLEAVRVDLGRNGVGGLKIRFCLCEKRRGAAKALEDYARRKGRFEIHVFQGLFEDNLAGIASKLPDGFTFTFIDPKGWNVRNDGVFRFLKWTKGEFLLNFMADHINRHAEYGPVMESFGRFLADPDWAEDFANLPDDWSNQDCVLHLLKGSIRRSGAATFLPEFSIMLPRQDRVKMRLMLGTHSEKGLEVFRDVQGRVEREEFEVRSQIRADEEQQVSLFSPAYIAAMQQQEEGVGCKRYTQAAAKLVGTRLLERSSLSFAELSSMLMEDVPIRKTQVKDLLVRMHKDRSVDYDLPAGKQKPQEDTRIRQRP